jgi:hypothetical protein
MGRAGLAGDEIGSALIGARLVRDIMRLCFSDGTRLRAVSEVVRDGISAVEMCVGDHATSRGDVDVCDLEGARITSRSRLRDHRAMHNDLRITEAVDRRRAIIFSASVQVIELIGGFSKAIASVSMIRT